jgi:hypothetical protein
MIVIDWEWSLKTFTQNLHFLIKIKREQFLVLPKD